MTNQTVVPFASRALVAAVIAAAASSSQASGFAVPEISIAGLALSNALVADTTRAGALPYNPAVMPFLGDASAGAGLMVIHPGLSVSDTFGNPGESFDSNGQDWIFTAMGHGHVKLNEEWFLGVSVNTPFGLETRWPSEAFATGFAAVGAAGKEPTQSKLESVTVSPSVTYRVNDNAALSGGVDVYWTRKLVFNTTDTTIENNGTDSGTGFHLAGVFRQGPWSFGASYFSSPSIDIDGSVETAGMTIPARTNLELPWRLQAGVHYQASEALGVEFDVTRTGWSKFDKLVIDHAELPVTLLTSTNDWHDANAYRLGVTYALSDETELRFGYTYDETPQDDDYFSPRIPDNDRHLFSVGFSHTLGSGWDIEGGYMYVMFEDRSLSLPPPTGSEPNGTFLYDGDYESDVHLIGLGLSKRF